jgi:iron complex transport system substrate-binding protein
MKRRCYPSAFFLLLLALVSSFLGYSSQNRNSAGTRTIAYYQDQTITVPQKIGRIASAWNAQNSVIAMLGYGDKIVATTDMIRNSPIFAKFVPSIKNASVCVTPSGGVSVEELIKAKPDVVFLAGGNESQQLQQLKQMGIPVANLRANSINNLVERAVITGRILGADAYARAQKYVAYYESNIQRVKTRISRIPSKQRIRVYHSMGNPLMTANKPSLVQDWMELAGVINVAEDWKLAGSSGMLVKNIDMEQIIAANPDVIICMNAADAKTMKANPAWKSIQAVRSGKIYVNPQGMFLWCRETTEEALQFLWVAKTVYPAYFQDIDMEKETRLFYRDFYGFNLSDEDVRLFLNPI